MFRRCKSTFYDRTRGEDLWNPLDLLLAFYPQSQEKRVIMFDWWRLARNFWKKRVAGFN